MELRRIAWIRSKYSLRCIYCEDKLTIKESATTTRPVSVRCGKCGNTMYVERSHDMKKTIVTSSEYVRIKGLECKYERTRR